MHIDHSEARVIEFEIECNWATFRAICTTNSSWDVNCRSVKRINRLDRCSSYKKCCEARVCNMTGDTNIIFFHSRICFLELGRNSAQPSLSGCLLSVTTEERTFASVNNLLQINAVDFNWTAIKLWRINDEKIVQVLKRCWQSEMTVNRWDMK